jgi:hypothetical protein
VVERRIVCQGCGARHRQGDFDVPVLDEFWAAFVAADEARLRGVLADDVAFASPAFAEPTLGAPVVARVLITARGIYQGLAATHVLDGAVFFAATVGAERIQGVYRVDVDGERIVRLDALFRPISATTELVRRMMEQLAAGADS